MSPRERDRQDRRELAEALFSGSRRVHAENTSLAQSVNSVTALWRHSAEGDETYLATALAAGSSSQKTCLIAEIGPAESPGRAFSGHNERPAATRKRIERLEEEGLQLLILLSAMDSRLARAVALSANRHLVLLDRQVDAFERLGRLLGILEEASMAAPIGVLLPGSVEKKVRQAVSRSSTPRQTGRLHWLGCWRPGQALPKLLWSFLAEPLPRAQRLSWALRLLE